MRRRVRSREIAMLITAAVVGSSWWWSGGRSEPRTTSSSTGSVSDATPRMAVGRLDPTAAVPVRIDTVRTGPLVLPVSATGQTEASRRTIVAARVAGTVAALPARESRRAREGEVLVRLDPGAFALALERAEAEFEEAWARHREMTLFDATISDTVVRAARSRAARAKSGLGRAEIALREARHDLARTVLRAPFGGRVADLRTIEGAWVTPGEELLTLVDASPIRVEARVVEGDLAWLERGGNAVVELPARPEETFRGRIVSINPIVDPVSRTARVTVELANSDGRIVPGMFARVVLDGRRIDDVVTVSRDAVVERGGRSLVFAFEPILDGPPGLGRAKWVYVRPGRTDGVVVELIQPEPTGSPGPLEPGALVLVDGHVMLAHDALVRIEAQE